MPVPHTHPADDAAAGDGGVHHRDGPEELPLEDAVEVLGAADSHEAVGVGELGEAAQLVVVLEAGADGHRCGREHGAAPRGTAIIFRLTLLSYRSYSRHLTLSA